MTLLYDWLKTAAKAQGNKKAVVYRDNYLSWRGLLDRVDRRAAEFAAMGIQEGAWVGLMLGNVPDFVVLALALSKLQASIVPIDPTTGGRELELILAAAPLRALVTRPRGSEGAIAANGTTNPPVPSTLPRSRSVRPSAAALAAAQAAAAAGVATDGAETRRRLQGTLLTCSVYKRVTDKLDNLTPTAVLFTSDSLGDPKGVLRTDPNAEACTELVIEALKLTVDSKILISVPLFHAYGWDLGFLPTLKLGCTMYLEEELSARRVGKLIRDHDIDIFPGTPTLYAELAKLPTAKKLDLAHAMYLSSGSALDAAVAESFCEQYGVRIQSCYHSTEAGPISIDETTKHPTTVGKVFDSIELKILVDGKPAPVGKEGVIWVRSKTTALKAIGPYEPTPRAKGAKVGIGELDKQGWLRTGDLGKLDKQGRLTLTGREDDVVKIDGKRVALGEVEGCLEAHAKIKAAQATVVCDPISGTIVIARVVLSGKCDAEDIIDHCARNLAPYKVPRRVEFCERL